MYIVCMWHVFDATVHVFYHDMRSSLFYVWNFSSYVVGRVGNRSLYLVMVWMPAHTHSSSHPLLGGITAMQLLSWKNQIEWWMQIDMIEMQLCWHWCDAASKLSDWYFPSFTLTQKTGAWPSDCSWCPTFFMFWFAVRVDRKMSK